MSATATKPAATKPAVPAEAMAGKTMTVDELADMTENAEQRYREAVITAARTGNAPGPRDLLIAVSVMGRTSSDFLKDVERVKRRIAAVADIADADARKPEVEALYDEWLKESAAYREVERECKARLEAARAVLDEARSKHYRASEDVKNQERRAIDFLMETADPLIENEIAQVSREAEGLRDMIPGMDGQHGFDGRYVVRLRQAGPEGSDAYKRELAAICDEVAAKANAVEATLPEVRRRKREPERFKLV